MYIIFYTTQIIAISVLYGIIGWFL